MAAREFSTSAAQGFGTSSRQKDTSTEQICGFKFLCSAGSSGEQMDGWNRIDGRKKSKKM